MTDPLATSVLLSFAAPLVAAGDITLCPQYNFGKIKLAFLTPPHNLAF